MPPRKACKDTEIRSPLSNRCIHIGGEVFHKKVLPLLRTNGLDILTSVEDRQKVRHLVPADEEAEQEETKQETPPFHASRTTRTRNATTVVEREHHLFSPSRARHLNEPLRKLIRHWKERSYPYLDAQHKRFCKHPSDTSFPFPIVRRSLGVQIPYIQFSLGSDQYRTYVNDPTTYSHASKIPHHWADASIRMEQSTSTKHMFHTLQVDSWKGWESPEARQWSHDYWTWILSLPIRDFFAIVAYTYNSMRFINAYLYEKHNNGGEFTKSLHEISSVHKYSGLFFYIRDRVQRASNEDLVNMMKPTAVYSLNVLKSFRTHGRYDQFKTLLTSFKDKTILEAYEAWVNDLRRLFREVPKTTFPMTLFRGYSELWMNERRGKTWTSSTFVSTSLNPFHSMRYVRGDDRHSTRTTALLRLIVPPKTPVLWVEGLTFYPGENEMILPIHTTFSILHHHVLPFTFPKNLNAYQKILGSVTQPTRCPSSGTIRTDERRRLNIFDAVVLN